MAPLSGDGRHDTYFLPDFKYKGAGAFSPKEGYTVNALFREGDFIFVDLQKGSSNRRCVYFQKSSLNQVSVRTMELIPYQATCTIESQAFYGPGTYYDEIIQKIKNTSTGQYMHNKIYIKAGTSIDVFFETDGWVFAEFESTMGTIRGWIPAESVSPQ